MNHVTDLQAFANGNRRLGVPARIAGDMWAFTAWLDDGSIVRFETAERDRSGLWVVHGFQMYDKNLHDWEPQFGRPAFLNPDKILFIQDQEG